MKNEDNIIGQNIRYMRKAKEYTIYELAIQADMKYQYLSRIETGKDIPSIKTLVSISNALGIGVDDILYIRDMDPKKLYMDNIKQSIYQITNNDDLEHLRELLNIIKAYSGVIDIDLQK